MDNVTRHAELIAGRQPSEGYGFAVVTIIAAKILEYAIPKIIECCLSENTSVGAATPKDNARQLKHLAEMSWLRHRQKYAPGIIRQMRPHMQEGAKLTDHEGNEPMSDDECDSLSAKTLDHARGIGVDEMATMVNEVCPVLATIKIDPAV